MHREQLTWLRVAAAATDCAVLAATWIAVLYLRGSFHTWWPLDLFGGEQVVQDVSTARALRLGWVLVPAWLLALYEAGSYGGLRRKGPAQITRELLTATVGATVGVLALIFLLQVHPASRTLILSFAACALAPLAASRWIQVFVLGRLRAARFDPHRVVVVGTGDIAPYTDALNRHHSWGIVVAATVEVDALPALLVAEPIDEVYVSGGLSSAHLAEVAKICDELGIPLSLEANFVGLRATRAILDDYDGWTVLTLRSAPGPSLELALKRAMDIVLSSIALAVLAPAMLITAVAIRWQDGGPVVFSQERFGLHGRPFRMLKFRTMRPNAEAELPSLLAQNELAGPAFKMREDPRITRLGRRLRAHSIDELPQLWNVLRGEMSLVGPRPPLEHEVARYERWQLRRLSMKPGITCSWQVSGRSDLDFDRWMVLDLEYIDNWTLWLDLRLILRTVPAVLLRTGAR